jgi:hypothetical protein
MYLVTLVDPEDYISKLGLHVTSATFSIGSIKFHPDVSDDLKALLLIATMLFE